MQALALVIRNASSAILKQTGVVSPALTTLKKSLSSQADISEEELHITKDEVTRFMVDCMAKCGTPLQFAQRLALNLVEADIRGHYSHGLNRLEMYVTDINSGNCNPSATPSILKENDSTAWVDGNNGLGVVVGEFSMKLAIEKAKKSGIGWVAARHSNHFGICQWYTDMAVNEGLIGIASTNTSPLVSPTRSKETIFGTNPLAFAAPARGRDSFNLDMSTSAVAVGKIEMQVRKGEPLPSDGWAMDKDGRGTTNSEDYNDGGGLFPLGGKEENSGYKGYGLGMMVDLMCGVMSDSQYAYKVRRWTTSDRKADLGQCYIAVDPEMFAPGMGNRLQDLIDHLRKLPPADPDKPVLVPGDKERQNVKNWQRSKLIKYTPNHIACYRSLAKKLRVEPMKHGLST